MRFESKLINCYMNGSIFNIATVHILHRFDFNEYYNQEEVIRCIQSAVGNIAVNNLGSKLLFEDWMLI